MPQLKQILTLAKEESNFDKSISQELRNYVIDISNILNKGIRFADNFDMNIISVTDTGNADEEYTLSHTLKRVPLGYIVIGRSDGGIVYDGGTTWTTENIYIKCTTANSTIKLLVF